MGAPANVLTLQRSGLGLWDVEDSDLEAVGAALDTQIGGSDMPGWGESLKTRDQELSNPRCCIEASREAGKYGSIERVFEYQVLANFGDELGCVRLPLLSFGSWRSQAFGSFEQGVHFERIEPPF